MIPSALIAKGNELRAAATRRDFGGVQRLAVEVGEAAVQEAHALPPGDPAIPEIAAWLSELYTSTDILVRIARAVQAEELHSLLVSRRYQARLGQQTARMRLEL